MPADIRSFFGGKGSQGFSSQEKPKSSQETKPAKKSRAKRKVVSDSEDDELDTSSKKETPKKPPPKKAVKKESPKGEATTTSDYFATNGKSKPARTSPVRAKPTKKEVEKDTTFAVQISPKATPIRSKAAPKADIKSSKETNESPRVSTRKKPRKSYAEEDDGFGDAPIIKLDDDSGEDIFSAEYKRPGKKMEDDYESDDDAFESVKPTRDVRRNGVKASPAASNTQKPQVADVVMKDESDSEVTAPKKKSTNGDKPAKGRKRKSAELSDDEDEDNIAPRAKKSAAKPSPAKRTKAPKVDDVQESKEMQDIFDSIPTIRPPTPPPRDPSKKFDFKAQAQRSTAAPASGTKEIPTGAENCLAGLAFVFTGILDTLDRDSGIELVKRYGGKVTGAPSSKTSYVVLGNDAGPKKLETIAKFKLKTINEDGLFALISKLPANGGDSKAAGKFEEKKKAEEDKIREAAEAMEREEKANAKKAAASAVQKPSTATSATKPATKVDDQLWTVKYAPTSANQICGNKAQVDKLQAWLRSFPENLRTHFKKPGKDGSGTFRAVMIYGGPGIGKTTAAHLAAKLEGYDIVESNASDTRSKKLVETGLKGVLDTTSLLGYFSGDGKKVEAEKKKLVLIMDEVDGMSAGDRGGVGALAAVCKKTRVPMILICNDRRLPKMKPFDRIVFDLPFRKPTVDQVRSRIMTIIYREGMRDIIPTTVVNALIEGSRSDIRQIINMISTAKVDQQALDFDGGKKMTKAWEKHVILRPWDIVQKILGGGMFAQSSTATLNEKIELYFNDHEFSSLMLQENYLGTSPILLGQYNGKERNLKNLELVDKAAESISDGDLVDRMIHGSQQQWSLMPTHAVFSFVRPASFVSGSLAGHGQIRFTSWLGNNSKLGKLSRFVKDIQAHMRLRSSGDRHEIRQQYLPVLWARLVKALEVCGNDKDGIAEIIDLMDSYFLTKDDWDALVELGLGPQAEESISIPSNAKSAFTRTYNQMSHPLPFMKAGGGLPQMKRAKERPDLEEAIDESDDAEVLADIAEDEEEEELDLKKDKYVSAPKKKRPGAKKIAEVKKGKRKGKDEEEDEDMEEDSEEDVKPKKGKGRGKR